MKAAIADDVTLPRSLSPIPVREQRSEGLRVVYCTPEWRERPEHSHREIEIAVPCDGAVVEMTYQTAAGALRREGIASHHVSIIPPGQPHAVNWLHQTEVLVMYLDPACLAAQPVVARCGTFDPFIRHLALSMRAAMRAGELLGELYLSSVACVLAQHVAQNYTFGAPALHQLNGLPKHKLRHALEFIQGNLAGPLTVDRIAAEVDISPFHFARMFKRSVGVGPHRYVTCSRVDRAKDLLRTTPLGIAQVAFECGFASQSHMTTVFRHYAGTTPKAFRAAA